MELYSLAFFIFIALLLAIYYAVPARFQWACLLAGSLLYYTLSGSGNILFILFTAFSTWICSVFLDKESLIARQQRKDAISHEEKKQIRKKWKQIRSATMLSAFLLNFGILAYLKYWKVLWASTQGLILPLGISFYTFMSISYLIDVYNEKYPAEHNFLHYLLFISWFPQLIQGPINRYDQMRPQFFPENRHTCSWSLCKRGISLYLFGAMKKYAVANLLSGTLVTLFDNGSASSQPGSAVLFGILIYSAQQYADFSGGIDMVMGVSELFGIQMIANFRQPYFSHSLGEFWRRWHISLGEWMKDYVFYPFALWKPMARLGKLITGKKKATAPPVAGSAKLKTTRIDQARKHLGRVIPASIANILVFFLVGLWHGPQVHYIVWGLYNGIVIALSSLMKPLFDQMSHVLHIQTDSRGFRIFQIIRTFIIVNIGWYFDRIYNIQDSFMCLYHTVTSFHVQAGISVIHDILTAQYGMLSYLIAGLSLIIVFLHSVLAERNYDCYQWLNARKGAVRFAVYGLMILLILSSFSIPTDVEGFMYANF